MHLASRAANFLGPKRRQALAGPRAASRRDPAVVMAYIALRNRLFREVKKIASPQKLLRLTLANNVVLTCLKLQPRGVARAQIDRQRRRCEAVRLEVAKLAQ